MLDKLHRPFFDAIHRDRLRTDNPEALAEWLQKNGVDAKKFDEAMKSFGVQSKAAARHAAVGGLPDRRHARAGGARPLHRERRAGPHPQGMLASRSTS